MNKVKYLFLIVLCLSTAQVCYAQNYKIIKKFKLSFDYNDGYYYHYYYGLHVLSSLHKEAAFIVSQPEEDCSVHFISRTGNVKTWSYKKKGESTYCDVLDLSDTGKFIFSIAEDPYRNEKTFLYDLSSDSAIDVSQFFEGQDQLLLFNNYLLHIKLGNSVDLYDYDFRLIKSYSDQELFGNIQGYDSDYQISKSDLYIYGSQNYINNHNSKFVNIYIGSKLYVMPFTVDVNAKLLLGEYAKEEQIEEMYKKKDIKKVKNVYQFFATKSARFRTIRLNEKFVSWEFFPMSSTKHNKIVLIGRLNHNKIDLYLLKKKTGKNTRLNYDAPKVKMHLWWDHESYLSEIHLSNKFISRGPNRFFYLSDYNSQIIVRFELDKKYANKEIYYKFGKYLDWIKITLSDSAAFTTRLYYDPNTLFNIKIKLPDRKQAIEMPFYSNHSA